MFLFNNYKTITNKKLIKMLNHQHPTIIAIYVCGRLNAFFFCFCINIFFTATIFVGASFILTISLRIYIFLLLHFVICCFSFFFLQREVEWSVFCSFLAMILTAVDYNSVDMCAELFRW